MKLKLSILTLFLALAPPILEAQQKTISGTVGDENNLPLAGVTIIIEGTSTGTTSDFDGVYTINVNQGDVISFSYIGYATQLATIGVENTINISLQLEESLGEVVVTAMGIGREKKSIGYALEKIEGEEIADVKSYNVLESLSGEVSGLNVTGYNQMGGSANIVIRGYSSFEGSNQALIIIDGTPINNSTGNSGGQVEGRGGYDYGNGAMDINPDNIESVSVLKGAAATALYGSRGSNGVILITSKTGKDRKNKGLGVTVNSSWLVGTPDKSTLPVYQQKYGAGYGPYYSGPGNRWNINGTTGENEVLTGEDASYGPEFDPSINVHHWWNLIPEYGNYLGTEPYAAPTSVATDFLGNQTTAINSISFQNADDNGSYRLGYTNAVISGILPNSRISRNTFSLNTNKKIASNLNLTANITYTRSSALGRYGTGYDNTNVMQSFRQWWHVNADIKKQKEVYEKTGKNYSWNMFGLGNTDPHYFDNPYWMRYNTYNTDSRNRYFGNISLSHNLTNDINLTGRLSFDSYDDLREERTNVGSVDVPFYGYDETNFSEYNYNFMANYNKDLNESINLNFLLGFNLRVENYDWKGAITNGGLNLPGIYTLSNSKNPLTAGQTGQHTYTRKTDAIFSSLQFAINDTYYVEGTLRRDRTSTLPIQNNSYFYPSFSTSILVSELIESDWLNFLKLRAGYAEIGNDTRPYNVFKTYNIISGFGGQSLASNIPTFTNDQLNPERTKEFEFGLETKLLDNRLSLDFSIYNRKTSNLLAPLPISTASGGGGLWVNNTVIENKGIEALLSGSPIRTKDFSWNLTVNFARNRNKVLELSPGLDYLEISTHQGGISIGSKVGEPYGTIRGRDFVYNDNGQREIYSAIDGVSSSFLGKYKRTSNSTEVLGDINPDWTGGVKNSFRYKNVDFSFLIDIKKGGSVWSLDTWYGYATGLYDFTGGNNELGNPVRDPIADGGGVILDGVDSNGDPNTTRARADRYTNPWGYARTPSAAHLYDASYVKLREVKLSYDIPQRFTNKSGFEKINLSIIGRNLWIIHKNTPFTDPEGGHSAGNVQGYQGGAYPSIKEIGLNLKLNF